MIFGVFSSRKDAVWKDLTEPEITQEELEMLFSKKLMQKKKPLLDNYNKRKVKEVSDFGVLGNFVLFKKSS